jgi:hypothetical protein
VRALRKSAFFLVLVLVPLRAVSAADNAPDTRSREVRNKAVAGRVFEEIFNQGKFQVADEIYSRVARLKWVVLGSLFAAVVLVWAIRRGIRRSRGGTR